MSARIRRETVLFELISARYEWQSAVRLGTLEAILGLA
jgi:hypothetical protein